MRLADFITANTQPILDEWDAFARSIWPAGTPAEPDELRDSAEQILCAVVADMGRPQSLGEQSEKSKGRGDQGEDIEHLVHASRVHGAGRVDSGLMLAAVVAEYRALRASVLRLWQKSNPAPDVRDLDDITRFNESIDQSLALAIDSFTRRLEWSRKLFLGILGHDLRNPLSAIALTAKLASMPNNDPSELPEQMAQIAGSAHAMGELISHLIDFSATEIGGGLRVTPARADLHVVCNDIIGELRAAHPGRNIRINLRGDLNCTCDAERLRQMIGNLVGNALQHGSPKDPVDLAVDGTDPQTIVISVHNSGDPIPSNLLPTIFDPLTRSAESVPKRPTQGSIGLGLYIVRAIAIAHGGTAELTSAAASGTTATIRIPRHVPNRSAEEPDKNTR